MVKIAWLLAAALVLTEPVASCDTDDDGTNLLQLQRKDKERDDREELDCFGPKPCIKRVTTVAPTTPTSATTAAPTTTVAPATAAPPTTIPSIGAAKANGRPPPRKRRPTKRLPPPTRGQKQVEPSKCKFNTGVVADCTNKDIFVFKGPVNGKYQDPTYEADEYGEDKLWKTFDSAWAEEGWSGSCVAYVGTRGRTCNQWCKERQGMKCVKGMDDAHHQTKKLTEWLTKGNYTFGAGSKTQPGCTLLPGGHHRQSKERHKGGKKEDPSYDGCDQKWGTQMCACKQEPPKNGRRR